jgi:DNA-binding cell septation regulator SpoVG
MSSIEVTSVQLVLVSNLGFIRANVRVILCGAISIHGIKVVSGRSGPWVSFPRAYDPVNRVGHDVVTVISGMVRSRITQAILNEYARALHVASLEEQQAKPELVEA